MSKCKGCGASLQNSDVNALGYTPKLTNKLCERCFKITNYNYHDEGKYINNDDICHGINKKNAFNFFMCDLFSLNEEMIALFDKVNNPKVLVLTKADLLPNNLDYHRLLERIKKAYQLDNCLICSTKNNAGLSDIMYYINTYHKVLFCGPTSSGKSSLINQLFDYQLTVSAFKNTTQEFITLKKDDFTIIDAPGFISDVLTEKGRMIKPRTINILKGFELVARDVVLSFDRDISVTAYISNEVEMKTRKMREKANNELVINDFHDLTIKNYGFLYFKKECRIFIKQKDDVSIRSSIVGGL